jgi:hypothetical protein
MNPSDPLTSPDSGDSEDIFKSTFKVYGSFVKEVETKGLKVHKHDFFILFLHKPKAYGPKGL